MMPSEGSSSSRQRRLRSLLHRALADPGLVARDRRCLRAGFCLPFFDFCDAMAYEEPERARERAGAAVNLGERSGDRHLANRGLGVKVNAAIALARWDEAEQLLHRHELAAAGCCADCLGDHLLRRADLTLEHRRAPEALLYLKEARPVLVAGGGAAAWRHLNLRATGRHLRGEQGAAIEDAGTVLLTMPLHLPKLDFRDAIGLMAIFLRGGDRRLDERALELLSAFKRRLTGAREWQTIRVRLSWLEGIIHARLADNVRAAARLESARGGLLKELGVALGIPKKNAPPAPPPRFTDRESRELVALTADLALFANQRRDSGGLAPMLDTCVRCLTLDRRLHQVLAATVESLRKPPSALLDHLVGLRASVIVPFPGLLAERYFGAEEAAARSRIGHPPSATPLCFSAAATAAAQKKSSSSGMRSGSGDAA